MLNGIGNGMDNQIMDSHVHHVTECIHEHKTENRQEAPGVLRDSVTLSNEQTTQTNESQQNIFQWMGQVIHQGIAGIKNFFSTGDGGLSDHPSDSVNPQHIQVASDSVMAQLMPDEKAVSDTTAKYFVPAQEEIPANNWYVNLKSRVRIKFGEYVIPCLNISNRIRTSIWAQAVAEHLRTNRKKIKAASAYIKRMNWK